MEHSTAPQDLTVLPTLFVDLELRRVVHDSFASEHDFCLRHELSHGVGRLAVVHI